jgi:hypothetical protein
VLPGGRRPGCDGVKPDARKYRCEHSGKKAVYGAEELLLLLLLMMMMMMMMMML